MGKPASHGRASTGVNVLMQSAMTIGQLLGPALSGILIAVIGATAGLITPLVSTSLQERTPKDLMAWVFGLFNTGTMVFSMIGITVFGWTADRFGPGVSLVTIGVVNGVAAAVSIRLRPWCYRLAKQTQTRLRSPFAGPRSRGQLVHRLRQVGLVDRQ